MSLGTQVDHLVVAARSLAEGVAWCEETLGVSPGPGGEHPLFGTHNRLLRIANVNFPLAYLEIIAINPEAKNPTMARAKRWFDLDSEALQAQLASGPRLIHFVARSLDVHAAQKRLHALGIDRGPILAASRMTPSGLLQWQITVRADGQRLFQGALPTLLEWGETHPVQSMLDGGVSLHSLCVQHPQAELLQSAYSALDLRSVKITAGAAQLQAELITPKGRVILHSGGI